MTLQDLGNIGEFLGGLAVIASLVYLALQIRQNTKSVRAATFQAISDATQARQLARANRDSSRVWRIDMSAPGDLDQDELAQFMVLLLASVRGYENQHFQFRQGMIDPELWEGSARAFLSWVVPSQGFQQFWRACRPWFSEEFAGWVDAAESERSASIEGAD